MALKSLTIRDFRVHTDLNSSFTGGITVITGPNGAGKTSILEAISILGSARSFRSGKNVDFIRKGMEQSVLRAEVETNGLKNTVSVEINGSRKRATLNQKNLSRRRQVLEIMPFVIFSPGDHQIVEGDASDRRAFLNRGLCNFDFEYADLLRDYQKVLLHRNQLLKRAQKQAWPVDKLGKDCEPWDEQIIHLGADIVARRLEYLKKLESHLTQQYRALANNSAAVEITYLAGGEAPFTSAETKVNLMEFLRNSLQASRQIDILRGTTGTGPHRDEISLTLDGNKVKFYASQGEKRTVVLALRLAEVELFRDERNRDPILLIDDVSSELDRTRRRALVELLRKGESQVLLTATELPVDLLRDVDHPFEHWDLTEPGHA